MLRACVRSFTPLVQPVFAPSLAEDVVADIRNGLEHAEAAQFSVTIRHDSGALSRPVDNFGARFSPPRNETTPQNVDPDEYAAWLAQLLHDVPCKGVGDVPIAALLVLPASLPAEELSRQIKELVAATHVSSSVLYYVWLVGDASDTLDALKSQYGVHCALVEPSEVVEAARKMIASSVIPFMEQCITLWQHPPADKAGQNRFGSRLLNMSKRLVLSASSSSAIANLCPPPPQIDVAATVAASLQRGFPPSPPPSNEYDQVYRLAGIALVLRDFKLAHAAYEALRRDYGSTLGWALQASVQELNVVAALLNTDYNDLSKLEPLVDAAVFTYLSRLNQPTHALRCCLVTSELLSERSPDQGALAARWLSKMLTVPALAPLTTPVVMDRLSVEYSARKWDRKAALWIQVAALARRDPDAIVAIK